MTETTKKTFAELLDDFSIEIPILQRDYAQGRLDEHAEMVRGNLLSDMKNAICSQKSLDLNFVYGKEEEKNGKAFFIPVDGQQRLTTLFLLHVYAYRNDDKKTECLEKFTYETRISSREFIKALVNNRKAVLCTEEKPSVEIMDCPWYMPQWRHDPTICSALVMLDAIKERFPDKDNNLSSVLSGEQCPIFFQFLSMNDLGVADDLYIKLNARGRPLTSFENFKARFLDKLKTLENKKFNDVESKIDGAWTDFFWKESEEDIDKDFLSFFHVLLFAYDNKEIKESDSNWISKYNYDDINNDILEKIYYTLEYLCTPGTPGDNELSRIKKIILACLRDKTYSNRVLFQAVIIGLWKSEGQNDDFFKDWLRITQNLIKNTTISHKEEYINAVDGLNNLSKNYVELLNWFSSKANDTNVSGFNREQIKEEIEKARIICGDQEFAKVIREAEKQPYFSGQIRAALYLAKNGSGDYDRGKFEDYWSKITALFNDTSPREGLGRLMRRALLSYGKDYPLSVSNGKLTLCVDNSNDEFASLKRCFSNCGESVKQLLDSLQEPYDNDNIKNQLQKIIDEASIQENDWRYCIINFDSPFNYMSKEYMRLQKVDNKMIIIPKSYANGRNYDLYLVALHKKLENEMKESVNLRLENDVGSAADRRLIVSDVNDNSRSCTIRSTIENEEVAFCIEYNSNKKEPTDSVNPLSEAAEKIQRWYAGI